VKREDAHSVVVAEHGESRHWLPFGAIKGDWQSPNAPASLTSLIQFHSSVLYEPEWWICDNRGTSVARRSHF
jgi:hypothetical protein